MERIAELALSKKAENVVALDLRGLSSSCDFFVICHGMSDVQVKAIADAIRDGIRDDGQHVWHTEGYEARQWILLDYVDVVVHVFEVERRDYYQLERLWGDAPQREFKDEEAPSDAPDDAVE
ncbi:ribosome silencing factor [bacterium]|nr:ribosome silencing factor [bacterium]